jgi:PII-like signaling protein
MLEEQIILDEGDVYKGEAMHEYIMRYLMYHNISGDPLFVAVEGYRQKHHLHQPPKIGNVDEEPTMILFINEEKK